MMLRGNVVSTDDERGFTLVEVLVAVAIIAVVMLGAGAVFVSTAAGTDAAGSKQVAARIATDGLDMVHGLVTSGVNTGRSKTAVQQDWTTRPAAVTALLGSVLGTAYDPTAVPGTPNTDASAPLPTGIKYLTVDGVRYGRQFFINTCLLDTSQKCGGATGVPMDNVAVYVTWPSKACKTGTCSYAVSTLMADNTTDPQFNLATVIAAPVVNAITGPVMDLTEAVTGLTASATASGALYWTASGLPAGVTIDAPTGTFSGAPTAVGTSTVTLTATDAYGQAGQTQFTWVVNPLPALVNGTAQLLKTLDLTTVLSPPTGIGGTGKSTWACTGLLPGMTVSSDGVLTGLGTLVTSLVTITCTVTDQRGKTSAPATLTLTPLGSITLKVPAPSTSVLVRGTKATFTTATATGCVLGCTYTVSGLPTGVTINASTGVVSGTLPAATKGYTLTPVVTVTDGLGRTASASSTWVVK